MAFYYYQAEDTTFNVVGLTEYEGDLVNKPAKDEQFVIPFIGAIDNITDFVLESLSWFSPFALVKALLANIVPMPIYEPLNLLILRPIGWIGTLIMTEWVVNKIRGSSET